MEEAHLVTMDKYGRVRLPKNMVRKLKTRRFLAKRLENGILLVPITEKNLEELFDSIEVDIDPRVFAEGYEALKKTVLGREP